MSKGYKMLIAEANAVVNTIPAADAIKQLHNQDVVFIDIRDLPEIERDGKIPSAVHASRGLLEFYADPESPYHKDIFASGKQIVLYCASGGRSALAAQCLQEMGFNNIAHIGGGIKAWKEVGGDIQAQTTNT